MNVQTIQRPTAQLSIDEFFDWAETKPERYELVDGVPRLLPHVKRNHNRLVVNIVGLLDRVLDLEQFEIATGDFAIPTGPRSIRFADVMVESAGGSGQARVTETALLIVEVLSPSTAAESFGRKQREYFNLSTLDTYLILDQDARRAWQWTRGSDGAWPDDPLVIEEGSVEVSKLGVSLPLDELYRNVS